MIHDNSLAAQLPGDPPVAVATEPITDRLNARNQRRFIHTLSSARAIIAGATSQVHEAAGPRPAEAFGPLTIEELTSLVDRADGSVFLSSSFSIVS